MKKNFYLHFWAIIMVSMLCTVFSSCGKNDDDDQKKQEKINPDDKIENADLIGWWTCYVDWSFGPNGGDKNYLAIHFVDDQVAVWYGGVTNKKLDGWIDAFSINGEKYYVDPDFKVVVSYYRDNSTILIPSQGWTWTLLEDKVYYDTNEFIKNSSVSEK